MNRQSILSFRIITAIFWLGFFIAISFMEAPLKFTAPGLSVPEGLQIGKIIFGALNKCEWVFLFIILITSLLKRPSRFGSCLIVIMLLIMLMETAWLLPVLDAGANKVIQGKPFNDHELHWVYVILEVIKIPILLLIALDDIKAIKQPEINCNNTHF